MPDQNPLHLAIDLATTMLSGVHPYPVWKTALHRYGQDAGVWLHAGLFHHIKNRPVPAAPTTLVALEAFLQRRITSLHTSVQRMIRDEWSLVHAAQFIDLNPNLLLLPLLVKLRFRAHGWLMLPFGEHFFGARLSDNTVKVRFEAFAFSSQKCLGWTVLAQNKDAWFIYAIPMTSNDPGAWHGHSLSFSTLDELLQHLLHLKITPGPWEDLGYFSQLCQSVEDTPGLLLEMAFKYHPEPDRLFAQVTGDYMAPETKTALLRATEWVDAPERGRLLAQLSFRPALLES